MNAISALLPIYSLSHRELVRFYRQRSRIIGSIAAPLIFWLFLGSGLSAAFPAPEMPGGEGYREYFFPGIVLLTLLFTSIFSNISLIEDRHEGFLQSVLVAPISRSSIVAGKISGGALIAVIQGALFLLVAPFAGFPWSIGSLLLIALTLFVLSFTLTALGFLFAWRLDSVQGFHSIMNTVLMPMWLLSGAFFPISGAPSWLKPLMYLNPLSHGLSALQAALYRGNPLRPFSAPDFWMALAVTFLYGLVFFVLSARSVERTAGAPRKVAAGGARR